MDITYEDYLQAIKVIKAFKEKINNDYANNIIIKKKNVKEQIFKMLSRDNTLRNVDIAESLGISKQLVNIYKKKYFESIKI